MTFSKLKKKFKGENRTGFQTQEDLVLKKSVTNFIIGCKQKFFGRWLNLRKYSKFGAIVKNLVMSPSQGGSS